MEIILIVDAFSTGENFIEDILKRSFLPVVLWSKRSDVIFNAMEGIRASIEHRYKDQASFFVECDTYEQTLSVVKKLSPRFVFPGADLGVELSMTLVEDLGLPGNKTERIPIMTNKFLMHKTLIEHGLRGIRGKIVHNWDETIQFYRKEEFSSCVLKPCRGTSSLGVRICESEEELRAAYDEVFASGNCMGGGLEEILLQERIVGTEYIVNTVSYDGHHKISAVWKHSKKKVVGGGVVYNYTESLSTLETGCTSLIRYAFDVLNTLGVKYGNVHGEFMIDENGPVLIEVNCRPMGSDMEAAFLDRIWGHHETDLILDAYLHPDFFIAHVNDPFRPLAKGVKKHLISYEEKTFNAVPILPITRRLKSFAGIRLRKTIYGYLERTVDLDTSAGIVYLANENEMMLIRDLDFLERSETRYLEMFFSGKEKKVCNHAGQLKKTEEVIINLRLVGSVLVCSNRLKEIPGVTVVSEENLSKVKEGFSYGIFDIGFSENENIESMIELFFTLSDKVKKGGQIIVPESTYWHFPYGIESIEMLCEAIGLLIEAPVQGEEKMICACKVTDC